MGRPTKFSTPSEYIDVVFINQKIILDMLDLVDMPTIIFCNVVDLIFETVSLK